MAIPEFKDIVTHMKVNDISEPFKTDFGYHIVRLNSREEPRALSLERDWDKIQTMALNYKIDREYKSWIAKLKEDIPIEYKITSD